MFEEYEQDVYQEADWYAVHFHDYYEEDTDTTYNREDNDQHKFNVPEELLERFDSLLSAYTNAKRFTEEYYELEAQFCNEFEEYMVG